MQQSSCYNMQRIGTVTSLLGQQCSSSVPSSVPAASGWNHWGFMELSIASGTVEL